jgi:hypothetical protein
MVQPSGETGHFCPVLVKSGSRNRSCKGSWQTVNLLALRLQWFESTPAHSSTRAAFQLSEPIASNRLKSRWLLDWCRWKPVICQETPIVLTNFDKFTDSRNDARDYGRFEASFMKELLAGILIMLQTVGQWLAQNALWLTAVAAVLAIVEWFLKPFRWIASFRWSPIKHQSKPEAALPSAHLAFVAIPEQCRCVLGKAAGNRVMTQTDTHWYVTNATESRMPVQLLKARLLEPRVRHPSARCYANTARFVDEPVGEVYSPEHKIPSGEMRKVSIHFFVELHLQRPGKPLMRVRFAVTDQLAKEHPMPPILVPVHAMGV